MFTTPTRSPMTPVSAPKTSGTASATAPDRTPASGIVWSCEPPAPAHTRNPQSPAAAKTIVAQIGTRRPRVVSQNAHAVNSAMMTVTAMPVGRPGAKRCGICQASSGGVMKNSADSAEPSATNSTPAMTVKTA